MNAQTPSSNAIEVCNVTKSYRIWRNPKARLTHPLRSALARILPSFLQAGILDASRKRKTESPDFHDFLALDGVNLCIRRGEAIGIVGRNGSGKSTLLQIIAGTLMPTSGIVQISGRVAALLELGSGFNPEFTGRENIYLYASILGLKQAEVTSRFDSIAEFADIGEFIDQPLKTYSSGMTVRIAFAVQSAINPEVLIVDEALAVGDEGFQRKCLARIQALKQTGTTILFVSHAPQDIIRFCDRAVMLNEGRVVFSNEPARVIALYQKFLYGSPETRELILRSPEAALKVPAAPVSVAPTPARPPQAGDPILEADSPLEFFSPDLRSHKEVRFDSLGAEIIDFRVLTKSGRRVNHLVCRRPYRVEMNIVFSSSFQQIGVGVMLTDKNGIEVAGASSWDRDDLLMSVMGDSQITVAFDFTCLLNPGVYFLRLGVASKEHGFIHRIMDAAALQVASNEKTCSTGYTDCLFSLSFNPIAHSFTP